MAQDQPQGLGADPHHLAYPGKPSGVAGQLEGLGDLDVTVGLAFQADHRFQVIMEAQLPHRPGGLPQKVPGRRQDGRLGLAGDEIRWNLPGAIAPDHVHGPAQEIPHPVGQLGIIGMEKAFPGKVPVLPEGDRAEQVIAEDIRGVSPAKGGDLFKRDEVAQGLGHLPAFRKPPAVGKYRPGQGQVQSQEQGRPIDRVKPEDVLAQELDVGRPETPETSLLARARGGPAQGGEVVGQGIHPDINALGRVVGHGDPPVHELAGAAGNTEVAGPLDPELAQNLVAAGNRENEIGIFLDMLDQGRNPGGKPEEPGFLAVANQGRTGDRAQISVPGGGILGDILLLPLVVPAFVPAPVNFPPVQKLPHQFPHPFLVGGRTGPDKIVVGNPEIPPEREEMDHHPVGQLARGGGETGRRLADLHPMLVGPGKEKDFLPRRSVKPGQDIGGHGGIGVPDMGAVVDVVNRGGDVKLTGHRRLEPFSPFPRERSVYDRRPEPR